MQLVALNRGSQSVIATFEDEPYVAPFSGNVIELCPVGALTSTQYRFEARPWEIQNVPTVCGMCPVGCNVAATTREGKVKRILSRNHPEIDDGWLCDKGRFAFSHVYASDRVTEARRRRGAQAYDALSWDEALDEAEELLRNAGTHIVTALSGSETVEQAYALARLLRVGLGAHSAVMPEVENARLLDGHRRPLSSIRDAQVVVVLGEEPVAERAPIVDLWLRAARREGAEILYELDEEKVRGAERAILIWSGPGRRDGARGARGSARRLGRLLPAAHAERARRLRGVVRSLGRGRARGARSRPPARHLRRRGAREPGRTRPRARGRARPRVRHVRAPGARPRRPAAPGDELPRARGHVRQPRGPPATASPRRHAAGAGRARVDRDTRRALRGRHPAVRGVRVRGAVGADLRRAAVRGDRRAGSAAVARRADRRAGCTGEEAASKRRSPGLQARHVPAALLRPRRRARAGAPVPAPGAGARARRRTTHAHAGSRTAQRSR